MRIRKLELQGFKSFPDRTSFHFSDGISGVVGPNGCGKSNVLDAVKWCIGEQSARSLRGRAMEDVIFNGSASRPPMAVSEVSLTFVAGDEPFPGEWARFQELQVTRRLMRGGGSDYYVNRQRVRLRDITDLFLDTGVGNRLYSTIEQGQVGEMVQASPEQRRSLIEEAAGISRFKARRAETSDRLDATVANLERSQQVVEELEERLEHLGRQVDRAARYRRYRAITRQGTVFLALARYSALQGDRQALLARERETRGEAEKRQREVDRQEGQLTREREEVDVQERVVGDQRDRLAELEAQRRELESARMYQDRERRDLGARSQRLAAEAVENERRQMTARAERDQASVDLEAASARLQVQEAAANAESTREEGLRIAQEAARREADQLRETLNQARSALVRATTRKEGLQRQLSEVKEALRRRSMDLATAEAEARRLAEIRTLTEAQRTALESTLAEAVATVAEGTGTLRARDEDLSAARKAVAQAEATVRAAEKDLVAVDARVQTLRDLQTRHVGLADVSRRVLDLVPGSFAVAEELVVPEDLQEILAAALGEQVNAVAVAGRTELEAAVRGVRDGVAWLVCLEDAPSPDLGLAARVQGSERARRALAAILGPCEAVAGLAEAWPVVARGGTAVTEAGHLLRAGGLVRAGRPGTGGAKILGRLQALQQAEGERATLSARLEAARRDLQRLEVEVRKAAEKAQEARVALDSARGRHREVELESVGLGHRLRAAQEAAARQQKTWDSLASDATREADRVQRIEVELREQDEEVFQLKEDVLRAEADGRVAEERYRNASLQRHACSTALQALREELATLRERVRAGEAAVRAAEQALEQAGQALERARTESRQVATRLVELETQERQTETGITEVAEAQAAVATRLEAERKRLKEIRDRIQKRETAVDDARKVRDEAVLNHRSVELRLQEARAQLDDLKRRTEEDLGVSPPGMLDRLEKNGQLVLAHGLEDDTNLPLDLKRLPEVEDLVLTPASLDDTALVARWQEETDKARRRMDSMGDVNLTAVEEYREVKARYDVLLAQRADLETSVAEIRSALAKINRTCRERFREAFEAVNAHFKELYSRLSGGGAAQLVLTSEEDLLETGVEIMAQPPGKRLQHLSLLSGGEKAVVALSVIFSLFEVKPSPFCLLDEVDAPLDEGNGARFNDLLREMSRLSQFIVITHNKKTMECADTLYGVTMPDPGVSRLVTVQVH